MNVLPLARFSNDGNFWVIEYLFKESCDIYYATDFMLPEYVSEKHFIDNFCEKYKFCEILYTKDIIFSSVAVNLDWSDYPSETHQYVSFYFTGHTKYGEEVEIETFDTEFHKFLDLMIQKDKVKDFIDGFNSKNISNYSEYEKYLYAFRDKHGFKDITVDGFTKLIFSE